MTGRGPPADVDAYLATLAAPDRVALSRLRAQIRAAAPEAEEVISYQIPTYRYHGPLVHFAAQPRHLSFTLVSLGVIRRFEVELKAYDLSGRTIHFSPSKPLPGALVRKLVHARVTENKSRTKKSVRQ